MKFEYLDWIIACPNPMNYLLHTCGTEVLFVEDHIPQYANGDYILTCECGKIVPKELFIHLSLRRLR